MTPADFDYLRKMLRERSGLVLSAEKQYLAESRLLPLVACTCTSSARPALLTNTRRMTRPCSS